MASEQSTVPWPVQWKRDYNEMASVIDAFLEQHPHIHPRISEVLLTAYCYLSADVMGSLDIELEDQHDQ